MEYSAKTPEWPVFLLAVRYPSVMKARNDDGYGSHKIPEDVA